MLASFCPWVLPQTLAARRQNFENRDGPANQRLTCLIPANAKYSILIHRLEKQNACTYNPQMHIASISGNCI